MNSRKIPEKTIVLLIACCQLFNSCHHPESKSSPPAINVITSIIIDPTPADDLIAELKNSPIYATENPAQKRKFASVAFDTAVLKAILSQKIGGKTPEKLLLKFAYNKEAIIGKKFHVYAIGMFDDKLLKTCSGTATGCPLVYDGAINEGPLIYTSVPLEDAIKHANYFDKYNPFNIPPTLTNCDGREVDMIGFYFDAQHILEIMNNNASDTIPDKVVFRMGAAKKNSDLEITRYHIIAFGGKANADVRASTKKYPDNTARAPSIYDKADPYQR